MRLLIFLLTVSLVFGQNDDNAIRDLTTTIVGLDQSGIEQLNNSLDQKNAGVLLTGVDESSNSTNTLNETSNTTEKSQNTDSVKTDPNSVTETTSASTTLSTSNSLAVTSSESVTSTNSTSTSSQSTEDSICLVPYIPWSEGLFFLAEYKGEDTRIAEIMKTWSEPIDFYYQHGIGTLPTELNQQLIELGVEVVYDKSQEDLLYDLESGQCASSDKQDSLDIGTGADQEESEDTSQEGVNLDESDQSANPVAESEEIPILINI